MKITKAQLLKFINETVIRELAEATLPKKKNPRVETSRSGSVIRFDVPREGVILPLFWTGNGFKREHVAAPLFFGSREEAERALPDTIKFIHQWRKDEVGHIVDEAATPPPVPAAAKKPGTPPPVPQQAQKQPAPAPAAPQLTGDLAKDSKSILDANKDKLAKKGINVDSLKQVGVGTQGVAYDMGDKILKVTKDAREAKTSSVVAGKNLPNIIQIFDIWKFPGVDWFGLILEKVEPLSQQEADALSAAVTNTKFPLYLHQAGDDWNKAMQMLAQQSMQGLVKQAYTQFPNANPQAGGAGMQDPQVQQFVRAGAQKAIQDFDSLTKQYKMRSLFKSLKSLGIQYYDFHGGNYGKRPDGTIVLFDLGLSRSPGALPPELTEAKHLKLLEANLGPAKSPIRSL
jgi:hypothetical protein